MSHSQDFSARRGPIAGFAARPAWLRLAILFAVALIAFAPGRTALPPTDRDEARFAQASRQMLESGDFLDIRFQDEARYNKPAGVYWLQAASAALAGGADAPISAYRIPSWIGAAAAVALTAWAGAPLVGVPAATLGAALMGASILLGVEARLAKTDAVLLAVTLFALGALARTLLTPGGRAWAPAFWAAVGVGALVKGPIVLIPTVGAAVWLCAAERSVARLRGLRPLLGLLIVGLIAGPWLAAITIASGGEFWAKSVGDDMLAKVVSGQESHGAPPGYYLGVGLGTFWPWAVLVPFALAALWPRRREPGLRFIAGWLVVTWLLFELTPTKLPHYVLPAYPALALLVALWLSGPAPAAPRAWARWLATVLWAIPAVALTAGALFGTLAVGAGFSPGAAALGAVGGVASWIAGRALWRWRPAAMIAPAAIASIAFTSAAAQFVFPGIAFAFPAPQMARMVAACRAGDARPVVLTGYREPSAVFLLGTDTLMDSGAGAAAALADGRAAFAWVDDRNRAAFDAALPGAVSLGALDAFNYSNGRSMTLTLFAPPGREAACEP